MGCGGCRRLPEALNPTQQLETHTVQKPFFFLAMSRARVERTAVMSSGAGRNPLLPILDGFRTSRSGSQQIRSFQKLVLSSWSSLPLPLDKHFLNASLGRISVLTYRALPFRRSFYPQKQWSRWSFEEQQIQQPSLQSTSCGYDSLLHLHLPQLIGITCLPEVWIPHLVTPDCIQEGGVGSQKTVWIGDFPQDVKNALGGI